MKAEKLDWTSLEAISKKYRVLRDNTFIGVDMGIGEDYSAWVYARKTA
jgi:hypothetical protein